MTLGLARSPENLIKEMSLIPNTEFAVGDTLSRSQNMMCTCHLLSHSFNNRTNIVVYQFNVFL